MMRSPGRVRRMTQIASRTFNSPDDHCMLPSVPMRGGKLMLCPYRFDMSGMAVLLLPYFLMIGIGKHILINANHQKMMLNRIRKMNMIIIATRKVIEIENEQIKAMLKLAPFGSAGDRELPWSIFVFTRFIRLFSSGENCKPTPRLYLRRSFGLMLGSSIRTGRAGASGSKNFAKVNTGEGSLSSGSHGSCSYTRRRK